ncbi:MAG: sigma-70 family RNA polymerase sigma factor [bacterium]
MTLSTVDTQENYPAQETKEEISLEERNKIIIEHLPMIKYIASRLANRLPPCVETNDLIAVGVLGLMDAIEKYDVTKKVKFKTYAEFRVRGAILDELRALDWTPRSVHQKGKLIEEAYHYIEQRKGRPATDEEIAQRLKVDIQTFHKMLNQTRNVTMIHIDDLARSIPEEDRDNILECLRNPDDDDFLDKLNLLEMRDLLAHAIMELPKKEQMVLSLYYFEELTMKEIGKVMGLAESTISEHHSKAIIHVRQKLKKNLKEEEF